jgi:AAA+ ATPase superfamily predicted ATPase
MKDVIFREKRLIDREKEIEFFKGWFEKLPEEILWVYGPKSTGKTTLIEYIIERELFDDFKLFKSEKYNIKYINFRAKMIGNYDMFLQSLITPNDVEIDVTSSINLGIFKMDIKRYKAIQDKRLNFFDELMEEFKKSNKKNILVIDEIQKLEDIYIDKDKQLLKEFLNFCIRLTKETHISHVVILSSNTIFLERIYNDAKMKVTSKFYKINHLDKDTTIEWLKEENFSDEDISLIWEYLGGCIPLIQRMMRNKDRFNSLEEFLKDQQLGAWSEIIDYLQTDSTQEERELFRQISKEILLNGKYILMGDDLQIEKQLIEKWCEKEILFFEPRTREVRGNNRLYEKGLEKYLKQYNII